VHPFEFSSKSVPKSKPKEKYMKNIHKIVFAITIGLPLVSYAGEKEDQLIAKITKAYGGEAITELSSFSVKEHYLSPATGQSNSPLLTEIGNSAQALLVDVKNNKAVYDTWFDGRGGGFQNSTITDGEKGHTINYQAKTYGDANNADVYAFAGGTMRTSDAILVHELNKVKDKASLGDDERYMNRLHHILTMPFPLSADLTLYVDAQTFMVSKMLRVNAQLGNLDYVFSDYKTNNGVKYAASTNFSIAGVPNLISTQRELRFNFDVAADSFSVPEGFKPEGERIDTSEMIATKISDRVYHVGQGNGYSMFVDTSVGIIGVGGYPALNARFEQFQSEANNYKPLAYQVVTHHHTDHLGGASEAVAMGARLVTVQENVSAIKANVNPSPDSADFFVVGKRTTFGDGPGRVEVYEVSTIHAARFLVTYVPADKIVFIADHMGSPFAKTIPVANSGTVDMLKALDALKIDVKRIATAHNARIFSIKDMRDSVAAYQPTACSGDRPVCE
jgi:glyoxylase-like metal-dependent hydrolase (beta-lactamase superfamily II)